MIAWLDRGWRLIATAVSFALFGVGGLVLALTVFPLYNLLIKDREQRARVAQQTVHATWRLYLQVMRGMGVLTYECHGLSALRGERGALVIANHLTLLDIVFLMSFMDRTQCVVKSGVWRNPFMSGVVKATNYIPNLDDPARLLDDCAQALNAGNNLVIFPEGSRAPPGQRRKYQRGFAHIALRTGAPIRLVTISCTPLTLMKGEPWYSIPVRRPHWEFRVHERFETKDLLEFDEPATAVRKLCAQVEGRMQESLAI
jgi:1-acyl-sn-glycerol-3-phosphate acyltransferase